MDCESGTTRSQTPSGRIVRRSHFDVHATRRRTGSVLAPASAATSNRNDLFDTRRVSGLAASRPSPHSGEARWRCSRQDLEHGPARQAARQPTAMQRIRRPFWVTPGAHCPSATRFRSRCAGGSCGVPNSRRAAREKPEAAHRRGLTRNIATWVSGRVLRAGPWPPSRLNDEVKCAGPCDQRHTYTCSASHNDTTPVAFRTRAELSGFGFIGSAT
jgi:hypothetical protein